MTQAVYPVIGRQDRLPFYLTGIGISAPEYRVAREKGLVGMEGKDYVVQDGDVILFRFNV